MQLKIKVGSQTYFVWIYFLKIQLSKIFCTVGEYFTNTEVFYATKIVELKCSKPDLVGETSDKMAKKCLFVKTPVRLQLQWSFSWTDASGKDCQKYLLISVFLVINNTYKLLTLDLFSRLFIVWLSFQEINSTFFVSCFDKTNSLKYFVIKC